VLANLFGEQRALSFQQVWGSGGDFTTLSNADVIVNSDSAFTVSAFFGAVSLISDTVSTLPVDSYIRVDGERRPFRRNGGKPSWIDQPDVDTTKQAHYGALITSLLVYGNSYTRVYRDRAGEVVNLVVLDPNTVEVKRSSLGRKVFHVQGEKKPLTADEVIHIIDLAVPGSLIGLSRITKLKDALGIGIALQDFAARYFAQGLSADVVLLAPTATPEQAKNLVDGFNNRHSGLKKSHKAGILTGAGVDVKQLTNDPEKSQVLESRRFVVEEIARAFNIPPHLLGIPGSNTYASVEQNNLQWISHGLRPITEKIEWAYSRLISTEQAFIKFNMNALLRGDLQSRATSYSVMTQAGIMSVNDVRTLEDMSAVVGGDQHRVPLANINLTASELTSEEMRIKMARDLITVGFDPEETLKALNLPPITHAGLISTQLQPEGL
jgi:HK97 family phage portal protein